MTTKYSAKASAAKLAKARREVGKKVRDFLEQHATSTSHTCRPFKDRAVKLPVIYKTYTYYPHKLPSFLSYTGLTKAPLWNDVDLRSQQSLMNKATASERSLAFNCNFHPDFESKALSSADRIQDIFIESLTKKLKALGYSHLLYHFVFEAADKPRKPCGLHIHGTARIPSREAWDAFYQALSYASGNSGKHKPKARGAVKFKGYRTEGWLRYCLKNIGVPDDRLPGRRVHYSPAARLAGQTLLTLITSDRSSIHRVLPPSAAVVASMMTEAEIDALAECIAA